jgi:hypothetical protein
MDGTERVLKAGVFGTRVDPVDHTELTHTPQPLHQRRVEDEHLEGAEGDGPPDGVVDLFPGLVPERGESLNPLDVWLELLFCPILQRGSISPEVSGGLI